MILSLREPFKLIGTTLNDELRRFKDSKWCIVSCAEKSIWPSVFITVFLIMDEALVFTCLRRCDLVSLFASFFFF